MNNSGLRGKTSVAFAIVTLLALCSTSFGGPRFSPGNAQKAWAAYVQAQRQFQEELADLLVTRRPDLKELILVSRDSQVALIDRRSLEFGYLLANHPERIISDQGISRFTNYDWTDDDANTLKRANPEYEAAIKRIQTLQKRSDEDPQWPALRAANRALAKDPDYQKLYERLNQRLEAVENWLK